MLVAGPRAVAVQVVDGEHVATHLGLNRGHAGAVSDQVFPVVAQDNFCHVLRPLLPQLGVDGARHLIDQSVSLHLRVPVVVPV